MKLKNKLSGFQTPGITIWIPLCVLICGVNFTTGCSPKVGPTNPWVEWNQIQGTLRPELSSPKNVSEPKKNLRIVTFNLHHGEDAEGIASAFKNNPRLSQADVILAQEIQSFPSETSSRASRLANSLNMGYVYAPARTFGDGTHGLAIFSTFPLENVEIMELPQGELVIDRERRIAVAADIRTSTSTIHLVNVHLDTRLNIAERILQIRPAIIDAPSPTVLGGDFNSNPLIWAFNLIPVFPLNVIAASDQASLLDDYMKSLNLETPTSQLGSTVDFPVLSPRLDSIYTKGVLNGQGGVERDVKVSDHWPVWLDIVAP